MRIAIIGYGKMGREIEKIALERGHEVSLKITIENSADLNVENLKDVDAAIEFTSPETAVGNINLCFDANTPIVVGSTGWYDEYDAVTAALKTKNGTLLAATNCSIGVNIFFKLNEMLAKVMNKYPAYDAEIEEIHHTQKLDAPSGTAITLAEGIVANLKAKNQWVKGETGQKNDLGIISQRIENVPGTHEVRYTSAIDDIEIKHTAHNRKGFALGAVIAAEYIHNKKGIFTMDDVLFG